jgi:hypothetical protein
MEGCVEICQCIWFGSCYSKHPLDNFHINMPVDESGFEWVKKEKDALRFLQGRDGEHLIIPFPCNWCLFMLLSCCIPCLMNRQDEFLLCVIWGANLDALWGRERALSWPVAGIWISFSICGKIR